jgi:hypothetical protein
MIARLAATVSLALCCLAAGAGIVPALASALAVDASPQPYTRGFTCPPTVLPQLPNTQRPCS